MAYEKCEDVIHEYVLLHCERLATSHVCVVFFFFQAEDGIRDVAVTGVQTCALPIWGGGRRAAAHERAARRPRPGAARRRHAPVRRTPGPRLGAAPRVRARRRRAGHVREAAAIRLGAGRADLRDRLHHVAIAAPTLLDPGVRRRGTDGAVWRPSYGGSDGPLARPRPPPPAPLPPAPSPPPRLP